MVKAFQIRPAIPNFLPIQTFCVSVCVCVYVQYICVYWWDGGLC